MFTGIVEAKSEVLSVQPGDQSFKIILARPPHFDDLHRGDSIACNGVCLTLENFDNQTLQFTVGFETINVTAWNLEKLLGHEFNLERSLKFGDRIHGHLVSGHVDAVAEVVHREWVGECLIFIFSLPQALRKEIWKKSSVAINGVSLTVNEVDNDTFSVCLIPETLHQTQLETIIVGDRVNIETDYYMKGLLSAQGVKYE